MEAASQRGWDVCGADSDRPPVPGCPALELLTGHPLRADYKFPHEVAVLPPADAMVVAPATFNPVSKLAAGISDTLPLDLLNVAIGAGTHCDVIARR